MPPTGRAAGGWPSSGLKAGFSPISDFLGVGQSRGTYPREVPFTPGAEGAGVVESVDEGVRSVKPSDRVAFTGVSGAYAEAVLADADRLIPLQDDLENRKTEGKLVLSVTNSPAIFLSDGWHR